MQVPNLTSSVRAALIQRGTLTTTRFCFAGCAFCRLAVPLPKVPANRAPAGLALQSIESGLAWDDVDEVHMRGGLSLREPFDYWVQLVRRIREKTSARLVVFSPVEIFQFHTLERRTLRELLRLLKWAGADALGPGGSETFDDELRQHWAPYRLTADEWIRTAEVAAAVELPLHAAPIVTPKTTFEDWQRYCARLSAVPVERVVIKPLASEGTRLGSYGDTNIVLVADAVRVIKDHRPGLALGVHYSGGAVDDARLIFGSAGADSVLTDVWEASP
jgi:hypothetical protein